MSHGRDKAGSRAASAAPVRTLIARGRLILALALVPAGAFLAVPAHALPLFGPSTTTADLPAWAADRVVIRLTPAASRTAFQSLRASPARRFALGIPAIDRVLASFPGAWLESEFRGEAPPPPGSGRRDFTSFYYAHLPAGTDLDRALASFRAAPGVESARPIPIVEVTAIPNDSLYSLEWCFHQNPRGNIHAPEAWDLTRGDSAQVVALIDTGLLPYHPDISGTQAGRFGNLWTNWAELGGLPGVDDDGNGYVDDVHGWDFVNLSSADEVLPGEDWRDEDNDPNDYVGHGTTVGGLIGALGNNRIGVTGTAWDVRIMPLRVGWSSPEAPPGVIDLSLVARAIRYATRTGATIVNLSMSTEAADDLDAAIGDALDAGVVIVLAAGNNGTPDYLGPRWPDILVVTATGPDDVVPIWANQAADVDLAAPGALMPTTVLSRPGTDSLGYRQPSYVSEANGTSYAAPVAAGGVALVQARCHALGLPRLNPHQIGALLRFNADDISALNPGQTGYGAGRIDLERSVRSGSRVLTAHAGAVTRGAGVAFTTNLGDPRLALATDDGRLLFLDPRTLAPVASTPLGGLGASGLAAADLGHGRGLGLFVSLGVAIGGFGGAGAPLPGWPVRLPTGSVSGSPILGDLDGDGAPEIVCAGTGGRIWAFTADGRLLPGFPIEIPGSAGSGPQAPLALADLDGRPGLEIIAAEDDGTIHAFRKDGREFGSWPVATHDASPSGPVVARLAGGPRVLIAGPDAVHGIEPDGTRAFDVGNAPGGPTGDPALADLDQDGDDDLVFTRSNGISAVSGAGSALPGWPFSCRVPAAGPALAGHLTSATGLEVVVTPDTVFLGLDARGAPLAGFPPYPLADPGSSLVATDGQVRLVVGAAPDSAAYAYDDQVAASDPGPWPTPRGNFARTGSRFDAPAMTEGDVVPPRGVSDLRARPLGHATLLTWTAPSDQGPAGRAAEYDVRLLDHADLADALDSGVPVVPVRPPAAAGAAESLLVSSVDGGGRYFALRSRDASGNWSPVSNVAPTAGFDPFGRRAGWNLAVSRNPADLPVTFEWQRPASPATRPVSIRIHDISGRLLRTLPPIQDRVGITRWDGVDTKGHVAPAGLYVATLWDGQVETSARFALIRR